MCELLQPCPLASSKALTCWGDYITCVASGWNAERVLVNSQWTLNSFPHVGGETQFKSHKLSLCFVWNPMTITRIQTDSRQRRMTLCSPHPSRTLVQEVTNSGPRQLEVGGFLLAVLSAALHRSGELLRGLHKSRFSTRVLDVCVNYGLFERWLPLWPSWCWYVGDKCTHVVVCGCAPAPMWCEGCLYFYTTPHHSSYRRYCTQ